MSSALSAFPVVASPDTAALVIDPDGTTPEVVYVTAHTSSATSATITRGQDSTTDRTWAAGTTVIQAPIASDFTSNISINDDSYEVLKVAAPADAWDIVSWDVNQVVNGGGTNPAIFYFRSPATPASTGGYLFRVDDYAGAPIFQIAFDGGVWVNDEIKMVPYYSGDYHRGIGFIYGRGASNTAEMLCFGEVTNVVSTVECRGATITLDAGKGAFFRLTDDEDFEVSLDLLPVQTNVQTLGTGSMLWKSVNATSLTSAGNAVRSAGLYYDGTSANYASTPDTAVLDITSDIDIRCRVALDDWTPSATTTLISKWVTSGDQRSYQLAVQSTGELILQWTADGINILGTASTVATGVTNGNEVWVRGTLDVNDGAGNRVQNYYTSTDYNPDTGEGTWTQLGTTITTAGTTSIGSGTAPLQFPGVNSGTSGMLTGRFCRAEIRSGIDGTVVASPDANMARGTRFRDNGGLVYTLNGSAYSFEPAG